MVKRKQHASVQSPGHRPAAKRAKGGPATKCARSAKTKLQPHTINDELLKRVIVLIDDEAWKNNEDTLDRSQSRFAWVHWEDGDSCIVYKIERRGGRFLVLCCPPVNLGFANEILLNTSVVANFQLVDPEAIDAEVQAESWKDRHQCSKHVGDDHFWGSEKCHTCSKQLGSNKAYLFCHGCSCSFHTSCISDTALSYRGDGSVRIVDGDDSLQCPACSALLLDPVPHLHGTDVSGVVYLEFDMGTVRSRCKGTFLSATHYLLDDSDSPKPLVTIDPVSKAIHFERRVGDGLIAIEPLKMIICSNAQPPDGFSTEAIMTSYFQKIIKAMLWKFEGPLLDTATVQITLAVALPSG
ncbi:hypothetical protein CC86DRAFT_386852 [Ophiobolus disseminans]|uniref:Zinc finger PHD-type domain-containing protein n=1 Tax=Ophiobolus disseminans TaxID=1469910 RepID=A0A6A6ZKR0_9PLEO|nr:hypothetical protein CC86DRAFT_386852 [Ophiobolus disseminans]